MKNKFLTLEWFKGTAERAIEKVVASKLESLMEEDQPETTSRTPERQYFSMKLVNDTLTVVLLDGNILSKPGAVEQDYFNVVAAKDEDEIRYIISSSQVREDVEKVKAEQVRIKALQQGIQLLGELDDFTVEGNSVTLNGTSRKLPQLLVEKFIEVVARASDEPSKEESFINHLNQDDEYVALKNFFMWCCLNPRAEVAHELYRFLEENSFRITRQGFVVALRNVVTLHGSPELVHFISNTYNKVKAVWKKNPNDYTVFLENGEYKLIHEDHLTETKTLNANTTQIFTDVPAF